MCFRTCLCRIYIHRLQEGAEVCRGAGGRWQRRKDNRQRLRCHLAQLKKRHRITVASSKWLQRWTRSWYLLRINSIRWRLNLAPFTLLIFYYYFQCPQIFIPHITFPIRGAKSNSTKYWNEKWQPFTHSQGWNDREQNMTFIGYSMLHILLRLVAVVVLRQIVQPSETLACISGWQRLRSSLTNSNICISIKKVVDTQAI